MFVVPPKMFVSGLGGAADFGLTARNFRFATEAVQQVNVICTHLRPKAVIQLKIPISVLQRLLSVARILPLTATALLAVIRRSQPHVESKYQSTEASEVLCGHEASLHSARGQ